MTEPRILVHAPRWLGDTVLARPALCELGRGPWEVHVLARAGLERIVADLPGIAAVHAAPASRQARFGLALRLRRLRFAAALVLPPSFSAALGACLTGARIRIGEARDARRMLLTVALPRAGRDEHLATQYLRQARILGSALGEAAVSGAAAAHDALPAMPPLGATPSESAAAARLLHDAGLGGRPYLVLAPGARFGPAKRWPPERFAVAAGRVQAATGAAIVLVGEAADAPATRAVREALPGSIDCTARTALPTLVGLLGGALGVLANDSGTMHLAAALGRPVVGLFGSSNPRWTAPLGARAVALQHVVPCSPCYRRTCNRDFGCLLGLAPERVASELLTRVESPVQRHASESA